MLCILEIGKYLSKSFYESIGVGLKDFTIPGSLSRDFSDIISLDIFKLAGRYISVMLEIGCTYATLYTNRTKLEVSLDLCPDPETRSFVRPYGHYCAIDVFYFEY